MRVVYCKACRAFFIGNQITKCNTWAHVKRENNFSVFYVAMLPTKEEHEVYSMFKGEGSLLLEHMRAEEVARIYQLLKMSLQIDDGISMTGVRGPVGVRGPNGVQAPFQVKYATEGI